MDLVHIILKDHSSRMDEVESSLLLLKSLMNSGDSENGKPGFLDALEILVENLRKECYAKFADRDSLDDLKERVNNIDIQIK